MSEFAASERESGPPDLLTVEEAAAVLRIGRTAAYRLVREYLSSNGATGIPAVRYGKQVRVPRALLERDLGGPITWPIVEAPRSTPSAVAARAPSRQSAPSTPRRRRLRPVEQLSLLGDASSETTR